MALVAAACAEVAVAMKGFHRIRMADEGCSISESIAGKCVRYAGQSHAEGAI
jgi:hypothetical protein